MGVGDRASLAGGRSLLGGRFAMCGHLGNREAQVHVQQSHPDSNGQCGRLPLPFVSNREVVGDIFIIGEGTKWGPPGSSFINRPGHA